METEEKDWNKVHEISTKELVQLCLYLGTALGVVLGLALSVFWLSIFHVGGLTCVY